MKVKTSSNILTTGIYHGSITSGNREILFRPTRATEVSEKTEVKKKKKASEVLWAPVRRVEYEMDGAEDQNHTRD